ncbi:MAG TPA: hypothetical protein VIL92_06330 [Gaiellaceae bacterium]|jgi:hypothetical protein
MRFHLTAVAAVALAFVVCGVASAARPLTTTTRLTVCGEQTKNVWTKPYGQHTVFLRIRVEANGRPVVGVRLSDHSVAFVAFDARRVIVRFRSTEEAGPVHWLVAHYGAGCVRVAMTLVVAAAKSH